MESVDLKQININSIITLPKLVCIIIYKLKNTNYKIEISSSVLKATECELKTVTHSNSQLWVQTHALQVQSYEIKSELELVWFRTSRKKSQF